LRGGRSKGFAIALLSALAVAACAPVPTEPETPNFLILSIDTMRRDSLRAFDPSAPELPALDALARRSARFQDAVSTASWTLPAHASLLTGLLPGRHGATRPDRGLSKGAFSVAGALGEAGYRTVALVGSGYLAPKYGLGRGFDQYFAGPERAGAAAGPTGPEAPWRDVFVRAGAFLRSRTPSSGPFFLLAHTYGLHDYFQVKPATVAALGIEPPALDRARALDCMVAKQACSPAEWALLEALYDQELRFMDRAVGELLDVLEATGLADSTWVFVLSDHGEGFDSPRLRLAHGGRLHEDVIRIPVVVAGPGVEPGDRATPFSLVDVAPTLLELAGAPVPAGLDGVSMAAVLRGEAEAPLARTRVAQEHAYVFDAQGRREEGAADDSALGVAVLRDGRWYITAPDGESLYDMGNDESQSLDLAPTAPADLQALRETARRHRAVRRGARAVAPPDAALRRQLESLGYAR